MYICIHISHHNTFDSIKLDFNYTLNNTSNIKFGVSNKKFEIENGEISLIKWQIATNDDGVLQIVRILLEGPQKLSDYKKN